MTNEIKPAQLNQDEFSDYIIKINVLKLSNEALEALEQRETNLANLCASMYPENTEVIAVLKAIMEGFSNTAAQEYLKESCEELKQYRQEKFDFYKEDKWSIKTGWNKIDFLQENKKIFSIIPTVWTVIFFIPYPNAGQRATSLEMLYEICGVIWGAPQKIFVNCDNEEMKHMFEKDLDSAGFSVVHEKNKNMDMQEIFFDKLLEIDNSLVIEKLKQRINGVGTKSERIFELKKEINELMRWYKENTNKPPSNKNKK
jgi:hypothetical protein